MKKKYIIILIVLIASWLLYIKYFSWKTWNKNDFNPWFSEVWKLEYDVKEMDFESSISLKWTTKIKNEQSLRFNTAWRVLQVNYKVWDEVKKDQILAVIDSSEVNAEIEKAKLDVEKAKDELNEFIEKINTTELKQKDLDIELAKVNLTQKEYDINYLKKKQVKELEDANNSLEIARSSLEEKISNFWLDFDEEKRKLAKEKRDFEEFKNNFDNKVKQKVNEYYSNLETNYLSLETKIKDIKNDLEDASIILWINKDNKKFEYRDFFSAKNSSNIWKAKTYLYESNNFYDKMKKSFEDIKDKKDEKNIIKTLELEKKYYESYYKACLFISKWFDDSIESVWFSKSDIDSASSNYSWQASSASSLLTSLTSTIDQLKNLNSIEKIKEDLKDELKQKEINLKKSELSMKRKFQSKDKIDWISNEQREIEIAKNKFYMQELDFEKLKKTQKEDLIQEEISLKRAEISYNDLLKDKEKLINLSENNSYKNFKNSIKQAEVSLKDSIKKLENYVLKAPFNWKITKLDISVWDRLNADTQKFISISDPNSIEINVSINQTDITKVKKWMFTEITMNSYPNKVFSWSVLEINTTPKEENWITKFDAKILLEKPKDVEIYSWLKAEVKIIAYKIKNAIVVPFTAVETWENWEKYVTIIKDWKEEKREIELGFTDWINYEVKSWVEVWEKVLEIDYSKAVNPKVDNWWIDNFWWIDDWAQIDVMY